MVNDHHQLRCVRQAVFQGPWEDPIMGTSSASNPAMNLVKVFNFNELNIAGNIALAEPYFLYGKLGDEIPTSFSLEQNYPNPFNPTTTITFNVAEERAVRIVVFNSLGMEVAEVVNDLIPAGRYSVDFDASSLPNGTYLRAKSEEPRAKSLELGAWSLEQRAKSKKQRVERQEFHREKFVKKKKGA